MGITNLQSARRGAETIDYAVSAVPRQVAPRILKDCVDNKVGRHRLFHFRVFRDHRGARDPARKRSYARSRSASDIALVGPNCMGLYNPSTGLCNFPDAQCRARPATFASSRRAARTESISRRRRRYAGIRVNKAASIGNVLMLEAADYIDVMAADPATRVLGMYVEGVRDGRRFFESSDARRDEESSRGMEGRYDRSGCACDVLAYRIACDARRGVERDGAPERGGQRRWPRRDA